MHRLAAPDGAPGGLSASSCSSAGRSAAAAAFASPVCRASSLLPLLACSSFKNRRQVASYTGLCPSEYSSGERRRQGAITKHGNPRIRHHLVEAVWRLEFWQPDYPPIKKLLAAKGPRTRKRAAVAVARRLAIAANE